MVKMAIFSAWAELQVASSERKYLADALKPKIATLTPLWLASLREYARLRFEPDISMAAGGGMSGNLDTVYAALNRETLLQVGLALHITNGVIWLTTFAVLSIFVAEVGRSDRKFDR